MICDFGCSFQEAVDAASKLAFLGGNWNINELREMFDFEPIDDSSFEETLENPKINNPIPIKCPCCGANLKPNLIKCEYCDTYFKEDL